MKLKRTVFGAIAFTALLMSASGADALSRAALRQGLTAYRAGDYTNATVHFERATTNFPALAHYNLGNAHFRTGNLTAAEEAYTEALRTDDLSLQADAYFNLGNTLLAQTAELDDPERIDAAIEQVERAVDRYESALRLAPSDLAAKQNHERALRRWATLEHTRGDRLFERAEALLRDDNAKEAKPLYEQARDQFTHILTQIDATDAEAHNKRRTATERLALLARALETTKAALNTALEHIDATRYLLADRTLGEETDEQRYAFSLDPALAKRYEETRSRNRKILEILNQTSHQIL